MTTTLEQFYKDQKMMKLLSQRVSKHEASKRGHKHTHNLSRGQQKDADKFLNSIFENIRLA